MARRIDIELTSKRDDDTWTWRAAGAREPKGTVETKVLPPEAKVGDVLKVEVEGFLDGLSIVAVVPPKATRREPERIEILTPRSDGSLVTTHLARRPRREDDRRDRRRRDDRGDRDRDRRGPRADRGDRDRSGDRDRDRDRDRSERGDRRRERPSSPPPDAKPKPKRLRPAKAHRSALLESLPAEQQPIAEQLLQGGIPAVRQAIEKQNEALKAEGKSQVAAEPLLEIAEKLRHRAQAAVWRDRADAALASVDDLDLRDLRSVVNAADDAGRDQEARTVADQLREALANRVEKEQAAWVADVAENLQEGRVVRALRLSSRPPKAGSPLPGNLTEQLITATNAALTAETGPQRWATVLDALAYSPIRRRVVPDSLPDKLPADLREVIAKLGSRLPEIAHIFAIEPSEAPGRQRPPRRKGGPGAKPDGDRKPRSKSKKPPSKAPEAKSSPEPTATAEAGTEAPNEAAATAEAPATEGPAEAVDAAPTETTTPAEADTPVPEASETEAPAAETEAPAPEPPAETPEAPAATDTAVPEASETEAPAPEPPAETPEAPAAAEASDTEPPAKATEPDEAPPVEAEPEPPAAEGDTPEDEGSVEATASA